MTTKIALFHTAHGTYIGQHLSRDARNVNGRICESVRRPALISFTNNSITLIPIFTMTVDDVYTFPREDLVFGAPMAPSESLAAAYSAKYVDAEISAVQPSDPVELTTFPKE